MRRFDHFVAGAFALAVFASPALAQKVTFQDHILPLVENHCGKCHNPDKKKGDLDLSTYSGAMKGGGSGPVLVSGNVDSSKLWRCITHAEEPTMPPNKPRLPDKDLDVFKKWITGGLLETSGSKAVAAKPSVDLTLQATSIGKPDGPPPMPTLLPIEAVTHTSRPYAIVGLAASPWAPLVALAGQKQVLLYNTDSLDLLGILPFTEGFPVDLKFSRNGKLLLAGGGRGGKSGRVLVWDITTGERLMVVGEEFDTVLAADISPDQTRIALGGPGRLVKIHSTKTGELLHKMKKHTDWVTAVAFSPNGEFLATGDRNGGISVWDPDNGQEIFTLPGHKTGVTSLSWRGDSKILASSAEDETVKTWEMQEGKQARTWNAHSGGALFVSFTHDGRLVSCGRDRRVTVWDGQGSRLRNLESFTNIALRCAFTHDGARVIGTDFDGRVAVWNVKDGKRIGEIDANPSPLAERLAAAEKRVNDLERRGDKPSPAIVEAEAEVLKLTGAAKDATAALEKAKAEQKSTEDEVSRLKEVAAKASPPADIQVKLADARAVRQTAREATTNLTEIATLASKELDRAKEKLTEAKAENPAEALAAAKALVARLRQAKAAVANLGRERVDASKRDRKGS